MTAATASPTNGRARTAGGVVAGLLHDGYLVLEYAVRAGRLPDEALPNVIREVETAITEGKTPNVVGLSQAMNAAVAAIAPVTLIDLRSGRNPFDLANRSSTRVMQFVLCAVAVLLAALIAFYSYDLHREEAALRDFQENQAARVPEKASAFRKMVQQEKVLKNRDSRYEQFLRNLRELKDLDGRIKNNHDRLDRLSRAPLWPFEEELRDGFRYLGQISEGSASAQAAATNVVDLATLAKSPYEDFCEEDAKRQEAVPTVVNPRDAKRQAVAAVVNPRAVDWSRELGDENRDDFCFWKKLDLAYIGSVYYVSAADKVGDMRDRVMLQSVWILPFLSGVLGAAVFLLRDTLNPLTASFGVNRAIVRLAIGGVAGIIIGWFWAPSGLSSTALATASSLPLALAFLTGYSIDILFAALERVRRGVTEVQTPSKAP